MTDTADPARPLAGITVIELGHSVAAPYAGQILGDLGARVLKIENPAGGDDARNWGPPFWGEYSTIWQSLNRNKYSIAVNMKDAGELARLRDFICREADVVLQNMRPGLAARFGLGETLRDGKPELIYCNVGAFGRNGPMKDRPGYDPLMQAFAGVMSVTGEAGRPPIRVGPSIIDMGTGMWAVIGIQAALLTRARTGQGCVVDTSLFETAMGWLVSHVAAAMATGTPPGRPGSGNPGLVPYRVFSAADGDVMIAAGNDNNFARLAAVLGHPEWAEDQRYRTNPERVKRRDEVDAMVQAVIGSESRDHWLAALEAGGVPVAPLQNVAEAAAHPQTEALDLIRPLPGSDMAMVALPVSFDGVRPGFDKPPPQLDEDRDLLSGD